MYAGMCASVLYFGIIDCKVISQISFHGSAAGRVKRSSPAVVALIASAGVDIMVSALNIGGQGRIKLQMAVIFAICLVLLRKKWNPILVMVLAGVMQVIYGYIMMLMGI